MKDKETPNKYPICAGCGERHEGALTEELIGELATFLVLSHLMMASGEGPIIVFSSVPTTETSRPKQKKARKKGEK